MSIGKQQTTKYKKNKKIYFFKAIIYELDILFVHKKACKRIA